MSTTKQNLDRLIKVVRLFLRGDMPVAWLAQELLKVERDEALVLREEGEPQTLDDLEVLEFEEDDQGPS